MSRPSDNRERPGAAPIFWFVFAAVLGLTVIAMVVNIAIVVIGVESQPALALADTCATTWKTGSGAIIGLLGGRSL